MPERAKDANKSIPLLGSIKNADSHLISCPAPREKGPAKPKGDGLISASRRRRDRTGGNEKRRGTGHLQNHRGRIIIKLAYGDSLSSKRFICSFITFNSISRGSCSFMKPSTWVANRSIRSSTLVNLSFISLRTLRNSRCTSPNLVSISFRRLRNSLRTPLYLVSVCRPSALTSELRPRNLASASF